MTAITAISAPSLNRQLLLTHWRELFRNRSNFYFVILFPFMMLGLFLGMNKILSSAAEGQGPDFSVLVVPLALCLGLSGTCMTLTAGPIAEYRQHGTLRILGTTPVSRTRFIITHLAIRTVLAIVLVLAVAVVGIVLDIVGTAALWRSVLAAIPSSVLFLGLGYIIGSLLGSGQAATNVATFVQLFVLFASGVAFPLGLLSDAVKRVLDLLPTTYFGDLLYWVSGGSQRHMTWVDFAVVAVCAGLVVPVAIRTFRWEASNN